ncbi:hypothetical protein CBR_g23443 [Chara braunii]|uniref:Uncharacterized protein n=1 Tax=Chara braunii TaxID=69332 RepID=A0A388L490_CHABU|nr:hypothetical protein CBR_g23443 [Chara braunii]|eukprot:GBG77117.1 hypothetical protein CBR_g23443 [Chara braunii]
MCSSPRLHIPATFSKAISFRLTSIAQVNHPALQRTCAPQRSPSAFSSFLSSTFLPVVSIGPVQWLGHSATCNRRGQRSLENSCVVHVSSGSGSARRTNRRRWGNPPPTVQKTAPYGSRSEQQVKDLSDRDLQQAADYVSGLDHPENSRSMELVHNRATIASSEEEVTGDDSVLLPLIPEANTRDKNVYVDHGSGWSGLQGSHPVVTGFRSQEEGVGEFGYKMVEEKAPSNVDYQIAQPEGLGQVDSVGFAAASLGVDADRVRSTVQMDPVDLGISASGEVETLGGTRREDDDVLMLSEVQQVVKSVAGRAADGFDMVHEAEAPGLYGQDETVFPIHHNLLPIAGDHKDLPVHSQQSPAGGPSHEGNAVAAEKDGDGASALRLVAEPEATNEPSLLSDRTLEDVWGEGSGPIFIVKDGKLNVDIVEVLRRSGVDPDHPDSASANAKETAARRVEAALDFADEIVGRRLNIPENSKLFRCEDKQLVTHVDVNNVFTYFSWNQFKSGIWWFLLTYLLFGGWYVWRSKMLQKEIAEGKLEAPEERKARRERMDRLQELRDKMEEDQSVHPPPPPSSSASDSFSPSPSSSTAVSGEPLADLMGHKKSAAAGAAGDAQQGLKRTLTDLGAVVASSGILLGELGGASDSGEDPDFLVKIKEVQQAARVAKMKDKLEASGGRISQDEMLARRTGRRHHSTESDGAEGGLHTSEDGSHGLRERIPATTMETNQEHPLSGIRFADNKLDAVNTTYSPEDDGVSESEGSPAAQDEETQLLASSTPLQTLRVNSGGSDIGVGAIGHGNQIVIGDEDQSDGNSLGKGSPVEERGDAESASELASDDEVEAEGNNEFNGKNLCEDASQERGVTTSPEIVGVRSSAGQSQDGTSEDFTAGDDGEMKGEEGGDDDVLDEEEIDEEELVAHIEEVNEKVRNNCEKGMPMFNGVSEEDEELFLNMLEVVFKQFDKKLGGKSQEEMEGVGAGSANRYEGIDPEGVKRLVGKLKENIWSGKDVLLGLDEEESKEKETLRSLKKVWEKELLEESQEEKWRRPSVINDIARKVRDNVESGRSPFLGFTSDEEKQWLESLEETYGKDGVEELQALGRQETEEESAWQQDPILKDIVMTVKDNEQRGRPSLEGLTKEEKERFWKGISDKYKRISEGVENVAKENVANLNINTSTLTGEESIEDFRPRWVGPNMSEPPFNAPNEEVLETMKRYMQEALKQRDPVWNDNSSGDDDVSEETDSGESAPGTYAASSSDDQGSGVVSSSSPTPSSSPSLSFTSFSDMVSEIEGKRGRNPVSAQGWTRADGPSGARQETQKLRSGGADVGATDDPSLTDDSPLPLRVPQRSANRESIVTDRLRTDSKDKSAMKRTERGNATGDLLTGKGSGDTQWSNMKDWVAKKKRRLRKVDPKYPHMERWTDEMWERYEEETDPQVRAILKQMGADLKQWVSETAVQGELEKQRQFEEVREKWRAELRAEKKKIGLEGMIKKYATSKEEILKKKEEEAASWINLPYILGVELQRFEDGNEEGDVGLYSLNMAPPNQEQKPHVVGFEDKDDAMKFCWLLQSNYEEGFSPSVRAFPPKVLRDIANSSGFGITVVRRADLDITSNMDMEEMERQLIMMGGGKYWEGVLSDEEIARQFKEFQERSTSM